MHLDEFKKSAKVFDLGMGCAKYIKSNQSKDSYASVCKKAEKNLTVLQQTIAGENMCTTFSGPDGNIIVSYFNYNHTVSIITDPLKNTVQPPFVPEECNINTSSRLGILSLKYSRHSNPGNGLNMIYTLADGRFIVYDGGYERDAKATLEYLGKNATVAAWILTHGHDDHCGCVKEIAEKYASNIHVQHIICTPVNKSFQDNYITEEFLSMLLSAFKGSKLIRPHTGQKFYYANSQIEILLTCDDLPEGHARWLNETSLISRVYIDGEAVLMAADTEKSSDRILLAMYGDYLKSDILQVPHHGYSGGNELMYDLIAPKVAIWCTDNYEFSQRILPSWKNAPNYYLSQMVQEYFVADGENKILKLPYIKK